MEQSINRFEYSAKIVLYILAALLPIWFLPLSVGVELGREVTFDILIIIGVILWFLSILTRGEIRYQHSYLLYAAALFLVVFAASTFFSAAPYLSLFLADPVGETLLTFILGVFLMILAGSVLETRQDAMRAIFLLLFTGTIAGIVSAIQLFFNTSLFKYFGLSGLGQGSDFNVIGTANGLALFYVILLMINVGIITSFWSRDTEKNSLIRYFVFLPVVVFLFNLILINYFSGWFLLLGSSIFLFGLMFRHMHAAKTNFDWRYWTLLALIVFSLVAIMMRAPLIRGVNVSTEVSPSLGATFNVAKSVLTEGVKNALLGSGPGTFVYDWARYKDLSINQTVFWGVRFNQGSSFISTLVATTGILGFLAFLFFIGSAMFFFLKSVLFSKEDEARLARPPLLGFLTVVLTFFIYPANLSLMFLFFFLAGLLSLVLSRKKDEKTEFWKISRQEFQFEAPWAVFLSSLVIIFLISVGVAGLWLDLEHLYAAASQQTGIDAFNRGDLDNAIAKLEQGVLAEQNNFRNYQILTQARMEKIKKIIQDASQGKNVQQEFQQTVSLAVQSSQRAIDLNPKDALLRRMQGALYELIIPFIQGAERFAFANYDKAAELEPANPSIYFDRGRAGLVFADRIQLVANQLKGTEHEQATQLRIGVLQDVEKNLEKAIEVKPDYAEAHFLLAQTAIRLGNLDQAIKSAENARIGAPFDIGVAFQLGLLYYQKGDLASARTEFERAVSINDNYSNARYFLGLIYDRQGEKRHAIEQFEKIQQLNPDNQEVKNIIDNLRNGQSALKGIVPPSEAPEKRKETPVKEDGSRRRR